VALIRSLKDWPTLFISTKDLADISGLSQRFILTEIESKSLPAKKFGRVYKIKIADAQRFIGSTEETKLKT